MTARLLAACAVSLHPLRACPLAPGGAPVVPELLGAEGAGLRRLLAEALGVDAACVVADEIGAWVVAAKRSRGGTVRWYAGEVTT